MSSLQRDFRLLISFLSDAGPGQYSPELLTDIRSEDVAKEADDEPGSFSPELVQDYDGDEVVDPETDKADLVCPYFPNLSTKWKFPIVDLPRTLDEPMVQHNTLFHPY